MEFKEIYPNSYSDNQQKKFLDRHNNHWKIRIENSFEYISSLKGKTVLDLGCSIGTFTIESVLRGAKKAIGIDLDPYALELAKKNSEAIGIKNRCAFLQCDVSKLKLESNSIDIILAEDIFEHLFNTAIKKTLFECKRVLKKGGILIGHTFPTKYEPLFSQKKINLKVLKVLFKGNEKREYIIHLYNKYFGKQYEEAIADSVHCNPLDHLELKDMIKQVCLQIDAYRTHNLYSFDTDSYLRKILYRVPESHRHISFKLTKI